MGISAVLSALRRRWYIVLVGLLLTGGLVAGAMVLFPPSYTARGLVLLIPPIDRETAAGANPFLGLGGLEIPARVLVAAYSSNAVQEDIADRAPDAEVTVSMEESTRGPVIAVDVIDSSADGALRILDYVTSSIPGKLEQLQAEVGAPPATTVKSIPLTMDTEAEADPSDSTRMLILAAVLGIAVTALSIFVADAVSMRPSRRRRGLVGPPRTGDVQPDLEMLPMLRSVPADPRPAAVAPPAHGDDDGAGR